MALFGVCVVGISADTGGGSIVVGCLVGFVIEGAVVVEVVMFSVASVVALMVGDGGLAWIATSRSRRIKAEAILLLASLQQIRNNASCHKLLSMLCFLCLFWGMCFLRWGMVCS
jgi:hypothetical protein